MASERSAALRPLSDDLQRVFGERLEALVAYGTPRPGLIPSLALLESLSLEDLDACAARTSAWHRAGVATPLLLTRSDFARSLDAFPIEFGEILATHEVVFGRPPFDGLVIGAVDLRHACEVQAKSHLLHLREDYLEAAGRHVEIESLVRDSSPGFAALLRNLARLDQAASSTAADLVTYATTTLAIDGRVTGDLLALAAGDDVGAVDPVKLFPSYLHAMERLAAFVDQWRAE
jgi:hypothetical protein